MIAHPYGFAIAIFHALAKLGVPKEGAIFGVVFWSTSYRDFRNLLKKRDFAEKGIKTIGIG